MDPIQIFRSGTAPERAQMCTWLRGFNYAENGEFMRSLDDGGEREIYLSARNEFGDQIGGLAGTIRLSWLRIELMAVEPGHRRQGIGSKLVIEAEQMAMGMGCTESYVDTMSFQAPIFYQRLDYTEVGRLPNWDSHGHDKILLIKKFVS